VGLSIEIDGAREFHTTTDASGAFRFVLTDPGKRPLQAWVSAEETGEYRRASLRVEFGEGEHARSGLVLERVAHGEIAGIVVDPSGAPRANALVAFEGTATFLDTEPEHRVETATDAEGRFVVHTFRGAARAVARTPGWRQIDASALKPREAGGWEPLRLVLQRVAGLTVHVLDARGSPLEGVEVSLDVSADEPLARREITGQSSPRDRLTGTSAVDGRVDFADVWTDVELRCDVRTPYGRWSSERQRDGVLLVPGDSGPAEALVAWSGIVGELTVRVPRPRSVRGLVLLPDRTPAGGAHVWIARGPERFGVDVAADETGHFEWRDLLVPDPGALALTATHPAALESWGPMLYTTACTRRVSFAELAADAPIELVLEPVLGIQGTVRRADGRAVAGGVGYRLHGADEWTRIHRGSESIEGDGRFEIEGLLAGSYDLDVRLREDSVFSWSRIPRGFPAIGAGTSGVELVVGEPEVARVEFEATLDGEPVRFDHVLGTIRSRPETVRARTVPPHETTIRRLDGWPLPATLGLLRGEGGTSDAQGDHSFTYLNAEDGPAIVAPGWLWIGVRGWQASGAMLHPTGLGLVYLEPDAYRFRFELMRTGNLSGRIVGAPIEPDLCVALVDADGGPVQVQRRQWTVDTVSPTGASGAFLLQGAPVGPFTLRVGSEAELRAGLARHAQEVVIAEGENPPLEVRLR
jgi:hypothetical protein